MLKITVELFPHGNKEKATVLGTIKIFNLFRVLDDTYEYGYSIEGSMTHDGVVHHSRKDGYLRLLELVIRNILGAD